MQLPTLRYEEKFWNIGFDFVIGVDEVGRGALAGPVTVAAVVFRPEVKLEDSIKIRDSKQLRPLERINATEWIREKCIFHSISSGSATIVDRYGIAEATRKAMRRAIAAILKKNNAAASFLLVDAFHIKYVHGIGLKKQKAIVKGDSRVFSIAAASILAKTHRDRLMKRLSRKFPVYGWGRNKGYGTFEHREAIRIHGLTKHHRRSFIIWILVIGYCLQFGIWDLEFTVKVVYNFNCLRYWRNLPLTSSWTKPNSTTVLR